jgi:hypothetical protein
MGRNGANALQHPFARGNTPSPAAKLVVDRAISHEVSRTIQEHEERRGMLPLYTTRIEDLGQGDFVKVD